jgi:uncharacterized protein (DUF1778 family)
MLAPISMRFPEGDVEIIDRAARMRGRSRTDFVRDAAVRAAEDVFLEQSTIRMSPEDFAAFKAVVEAPPQAVAEMVRLLREEPPWSET